MSKGGNPSGSLRRCIIPKTAQSGFRFAHPRPALRGIGMAWSGRAEQARLLTLRPSPSLARGIPDTETRRLIVDGFLADAVSRLEDQAIQKMIRDRMD